ncbi:MAG: lactate utilization protein [Firmicutes bacterium]|nr:lactate utilization protein [Bacillota bacterium]
MEFEGIKNTLKKHGFKVSCFRNKEEASAYLNKQIDGKSVGFGGSVTTKQMGLYDSLGTHNEVVWHWVIPEGIDKKEWLAKAMTTDVYIASANALASTGEIINIDGAGNRVSSLVFGHDKVYYLIGRNKIADNYDEAILRARNTAAPMNSKRLGRKTPCAIKGDRCFDCNSPERICRTMTVTWRPTKGVDTEVVLVDEDLGF